MEFIPSAALVLGSIQTALEQPVFPGKIIAWLLLMLSILGWVLILSKGLHLLRIRRADRRFGKRLRQSRTTLELFEEGWRDDNSLQFLIYVAGARETAYQLLGSRNPGEDMERRLLGAGKLGHGQCRFLRGAFRAGYRNAVSRLGSGLGPLRLIVVAAGLLGLLGGAWTIMAGFDSMSGEDSTIGPAVGSALGFVVIALLVAIPAQLARIAYSIQVRKTAHELRKFRDDIDRLFERKFADLGNGAPNRREGRRSTGKGGRERFAERRPGPEGETDEAGDGSEDSEEGRKQYHSIRERLLGPPSETEEGGDEFTMNPIARQAAVLRAKLPS